MLRRTITSVTLLLVAAATVSAAAPADTGRDVVLVAKAEGGTVSFASYATARGVARVPTGDGPKHLEAGRVPGDVIAAWAAADPAGAPETSGDGPDGAGARSHPATGGGRATAALVVLAAAAGLLVVLRRPRP